MAFEQGAFDPDSLALRPPRTGCFSLDLLYTIYTSVKKSYKYDCSILLYSIK